MGNLEPNNLFYADDLIIMPEARRDLQSYLDISQANFHNWKRTVNNKKTKLMVVEKKTILSSNEHFAEISQG